MSLTAGIVGLPNVGKSTLFNAITKAGALAANYPFATIEPNVGVVVVPDERLDVLNKMYNPKSLVATTFEFTDIAGLVKGASKGEGLGNQFLANIRNVDAICHVVRCFEDSNVTHVEGSVDPIRDIEIINLELIFSDLDVVEKRIPKIEHKAKSKVDDAEKEYNLLLRLKEHLIEGRFVSEFEMSEEELKMVKSFCFLTQKPMLYIANVSEEDLFDLEANSHYVALCEYAKSHGSKVIAICAELEAQLSEFDPEERKSYLDDLGINESGLDNLIKEAYDLLGLATFFTAGEKEVRAWTFKKGMKAPQCAGVIHTDFEKGFIRAEVISYDDLMECGSELKVKEAGKARLEGKDYLMQDGDICHFRFNV